MKKQLNVAKESNFSIDFYIDEFHDIYFKLTNNSDTEINNFVNQFVE